jgi:hypothetical protein
MVPRSQSGCLMLKLCKNISGAYRYQNWIACASYRSAALFWRIALYTMQLAQTAPVPNSWHLSFQISPVCRICCTMRRSFRPPTVLRCESFSVFSHPCGGCVLCIPANRLPCLQKIISLAHAVLPD